MFQISQYPPSRIFRTLKLAAFLCLLLAVPGKAATFFNGSFESPGAPVDPWNPGVLYLGDQLLGGWEHTRVPDADPLRTDFYTNGLGTDWVNPPQDGAYYIGWGAYGATGGTLSQAFDTEIGVTYQVTYWLVAQEFALGSTVEQKARVAALDGNTPLANVLNTFGPTSVWFQGQILSFVAQSASTTLRFSDESEGSSVIGQGTYMINWGLDNVTVEATPEPGTWAILGLGLGILVAVKKMRG
jgi:hypothetical protein